MSQDFTLCHGHALKLILNLLSDIECCQNTSEFKAMKPCPGLSVGVLLLPFLFCTSDSLGNNVSEKAAGKEGLCRSRGVFFEPIQFMVETCALCYLYMPKDKFKNPFAKWNLTHGTTRMFPHRISSLLSNGTLEVGTYLKMDLVGMIRVADFVIEGALLRILDSIYDTSKFMLRFACFRFRILGYLFQV